MSNSLKVLLHRILQASTAVAIFFAFFLMAEHAAACNSSANDQGRLNTNSDSETKFDCPRNQKLIEYHDRLIFRFSDTNDWIVIFSKSFPKPIFDDKTQIIKFQKIFHSYNVDYIYDLAGDARFRIGEATFKKTNAGIVTNDKFYPSGASLGFNFSDGKIEQIYPDPSVKDDAKVNHDVDLYFSDVVYLVIVKNAELKDVHFETVTKRKNKNKFVTLEGETSLIAFGVSVRSQGGNFYVNGQLVTDHQRVVIENTGVYKIGSQ